MAKESSGRLPGWAIGVIVGAAGAAGTSLVRNEVKLATMTDDIIRLWDNEDEERVQNDRLDFVLHQINTRRAAAGEDLLTWP